MQRCQNYYDKEFEVLEMVKNKLLKGQFGAILIEHFTLYHRFHAFVFRIILRINSAVFVKNTLHSSFL